MGQETSNVLLFVIRYDKFIILFERNETLNFLHLIHNETSCLSLM